MKRICLFLALYIATIPFTILSAADEATDTDPRTVIENLQIKILDAMKAGYDAGFTGRYEILEPAIRGTYNMEAVARLTLGRYWGDLSEEQKNEFVEKFAQYVIANYASQFKKHKGEDFEWIADQNARENVLVAQTIMRKSNGDDVPFNYMLRHHDGEWRIVNISVKGISDLALKRAEFTTIMKSDGFTALLDELTDKIAEFQREGDEPDSETA